MHDETAVNALESLLVAMDAAASLAAALSERVLENERRLLELQEDVATLGVLLQNHATQHLEQHSIRAVAPVSRHDLEQIAETLRDELAAEVRQITARIDHVHNRALRALTDLTERKQPA